MDVQRISDELEIASVPAQAGGVDGGGGTGVSGVIVTGAHLVVDGGGTSRHP